MASAGGVEGGVGLTSESGGVFWCTLLGEDGHAEWGVGKATTSLGLDVF